MSLDLLLLHSDPAVTGALRHAFKRAGTRLAAYGCAKDALSGYSRARFDAVLTAPKLPEIDAWRLARMIRSGRFGFPAIPIVVACEAHERDVLAPLSDENLYLVAFDRSADEFSREVVRILASRPRPSVLLVEDDEAAAIAAARVLEKYFCVEVAHDGIAAIEAWRARHHDLVVLDLMLPGVSGEGVQTQILAMNPRQPIIILTAFDDPDRCESMMMQGSSDVVGKATNLADFASHCLRVLQQCRYMNVAEDALDDRQRLGVVSQRVRAANLRLTHGQANAATQQLRHAIAMTPDIPMSDDTWASMLDEFPHE